MYIPGSRTAILTVALALLTGVALRSQPLSEPPSHRMPGHVPDRSIEYSRWRGPLSAQERLSLTFVLHLRNEAELQLLLHRMQDPTDPLYGQYLSPQEFADRFGPTQSDYDAVAGYAEGLGLLVTGRHPNRTLLDVSGPVVAVESGFHLRMSRYESPAGREFYAPEQDPEIPDFIRSRIAGVAGLENANLRHPYSRFQPAESAPSAAPAGIGSGPGGGMTPSDIAKAYGLTGLGEGGEGQTLAIFALDGYNAADIAGYANFFGMPPVPLENVYIDGVTGDPGTGASETTLDIELQAALAPGASRIIVYQGPNTDAGVLHTYSRIANDNVAKQVSTSWGYSELLAGRAVVDAENAIFLQMAAQGQTIFAASGDSGAYDNGTSLSVDDPASQPYVVATGGTKLFVASDGSYDHESTWNASSAKAGAAGGGVSMIWQIPPWQRNSVSSASLGSPTMRNVPDVSLNSDPQSGYAVYYKSRWHIFGGTSCAAPLWAAFTARVNQRRAASGLGPLGSAGPALYAAANLPGPFHDIADGSNNLYYPAVQGFDDATGLGSLDGARLMAELTSSGRPVSSPSTPVKYYNARGEPYTNEPNSYWQTPDGRWWTGTLSGTITEIAYPPWRAFGM